MSFIDDVRAKRQKLAAVLVDEEYSGIREIVEELYPDQAHFIFELLQNAEDAGATTAFFELTSESLAFEHDGRPFEDQDVLAITNIGKGTKRDSDDKIGRFGVGFKAVFAYCETPHIYSPTYSFRISELVLPNEVPPKPSLGKKTRFEFPFNNPKKAAKDAYAEIDAGLNALAETTLLFLSNLESIRWQIGDSVSGDVLRVQHAEHHFEVLKVINGKTETSSHFLRFTQPVEGLEKQSVAIAFALDCLPTVEAFAPGKPLEKQLKIVPAHPGRVAVFFPAEKETSGLRFHLHAPFVPVLNRATIKETPKNDPLFEQLGKLTAASLHEIREHHLLTPEFLGVLPNSEDDLPTRYVGIRSAIVREMQNQPLTPTHSKSHEPAKYLLQAKASLKDLLTEEDIKLLVDYDDKPPHWAIGAAQKNTNTDRFLDGLAIAEWDIGQFVELLSNKAFPGRSQYLPPRNITPEEFLCWLAKKPVKWHQQLYALLFDHLSDAGFQRHQLSEKFKPLQIVRLSNDSYGVGCKCFFPSDGVEYDDVLPRVASAVYTSGRSVKQKEDARQFLEEIGVREVGESEQVEAILQQRYIAKLVKPKKSDLKRFVALVEKAPQKAELFAKYFIFEGNDGKWRKPSEVFLDAPFQDTGLSAYYQAFGDRAQKVALSASYLKASMPIDKLQNFAVAVGAQTALKVLPSKCRDNPTWTELRSGEDVRINNDSYKRIDTDFDVPEFHTLAALSTDQASRLIWDTMMNVVNPVHLVAKYQRNNSSEARTSASRLVHRILSVAWVPQCDGRFVTPAQAEQGLLPSGFPFDPGCPWLKAIGFGAETQQKADEQRRKQDRAKESGFPDNESYERAKQFAALPQEEQVRILDDWQRKSSVELPEHDPVNAARRAERVRQEAANAPERITEQRTRSVSVGVGEVKKEVAQYLRQQYTNDSGQMICQICKDELPFTFTLDDGTSYFEKVEFLSELPQRHRQNYLALCPNHSAMFQHANGTRDEMKAMFEALEGDQLEVVLAQRDHTIYFTKTHRQDLLTVIAASQLICGQSATEPL